MEPFSIACTTCHARLKVRDDSAIGHILACPKCGSMVLVEKPATPLSDSGPIASPKSAIVSPFKTTPPTAASHPTPPTAVPATLRRRNPSPNADTASGSFDELDSLFTAPPPPKKPPTTHSAPFVLTPPRNHGTTGDSSLSAISAASSESGSPLVPGATMADPMDPIGSSSSAISLQAPNLGENAIAAQNAAGPFKWSGVNWASSSLLGTRQILLVSGAGVVGVVMAVVAVSLLLTWTKPTTNNIVAENKTSPSDAALNATAPMGEPPAANVTADPQRNSTDVPETKNNTPAPVATTKTNAVDPPSPSDTPNPPAPTADPKPEPVKPDAIAGAGNNPPNPPPVAKVPNSDPLSRYTDLFSPAPRSAKETQPQEAPAKPMGPASSSDDPNVSPSLPRPVPRRVDVPNQLGVKIEKIDFSNTPLVSFVQLMSDFSTIPFTLDCDAIVVRNLSVTSPISVSLSNTTVGQVIAESLKSSKLALVPFEGQAVITFPLTKEKDYREIPHKIADLTRGEIAQAEEIGGLIAELIDAEHWNLADGAATWRATADSLVIRHSDAVHFQAAYLCDKLRAARGLNTLKYSADAIKPNSLATRAKAKLSAPITLNFSRSDRFTKILDRLGKMADCQIVVDWQAIAEAGWNPDANATLVAEEKPLGEVLTSLLTPMELTYRVIDDNTLQVSTATALSTKVDVEFYSVKDLVADLSNARQLINRLQAALGEQHFRDGGGSGMIRFDETSKCLIVALPQPLQREVIRLLKELKVNQPQ